MTRFETFGFFVEYIVDTKLMGTKNIEHHTGDVGYASTKSHIAVTDITFKNYKGDITKKRIKAGTNYKTRVYPLCGKLIK